MEGHPEDASGWPEHLPFEAGILPDEVGLQASILEALGRHNPNTDPNVLIVRSYRIVRSLAFLAGARESDFVEHVDAYIRAGEYGVRVLL